MLKMIQDAILMKLSQVFGETINIHVEDEVGQGYVEPCFLIAMLNPSIKQMIGSRFFRQHPFRIKYIPLTQEKILDVQMLAFDLNEALATITLVNGDLLHGTKIRYEVVDGILYFYVNYDMYVKKLEESEKNMETIAVNHQLKKG